MAAVAEVAAEEADEAVVVAEEECGPAAADSRHREACRVDPARVRAQHRVPAPAAAVARVQVVDRWLAPDPAEVQLEEPDPVVRQAQVRGQVLREAEFRKAVRGPAGLVLVAVLVRAEHDPAGLVLVARGSGPGEQVAILLAAVRHLANSTISSTLDPQPARLEPAAASERVLPDVQVLRRCQAARGGPAAQHPTSCKAVEHRSCRLAAQHSEARQLALAWGWHRSSRLAVRIVLASATDKLGPAIDPRIQLRALAVLERTSVAPALPMWADQELQT